MRQRLVTIDPSVPAKDRKIVEKAVRDVFKKTPSARMFVTSVNILRVKRDWFISPGHHSRTHRISFSFTVSLNNENLPGFLEIKKIRVKRRASALSTQPYWGMGEISKAFAYEVFELLGQINKKVTRVYQKAKEKLRTFRVTC